jgi:iron complex transport system permease protein
VSQRNFRLKASIPVVSETRDGQQRGRQDLHRAAKWRMIIVMGAAAAVILLFMTVNTSAPWEFVLPFRGKKIATMVLVAFAIAVSTVLFQTVTGNRILTPSIMGFDSLYILIQTLTVFGFGSATLATMNAQFKWLLEVAVMVLAVSALYRWLFYGARRNLHLLVLVGIILGTLFRSLSALMQRMLDPTEFAVLQDSFFATFNTVDDSLLLISTGTVLAVAYALYLMRDSFDVLGLGQDLAISVGVDHRRVVTKILILVAVLVAVSTALVGPITFFGLLVANLAYVIVGNRHALALPTATALGVISLVGGQLILERLFTFNTSLGIIIEFVGGIVFIFLLVRKGAR